MATALAQQRLTEERKNFRRDRPFGFSAKPASRADGSVDLFEWKCIVPGKVGSYMEDGKFPITIQFPADFPANPPKVFLPAGFLHVNVFPDGRVCLSILKTDIPDHLAAAANVDAWKPSVTVKQILLSIQELLHNPFFGSVANNDAWQLMKRLGMPGYEKKMKEQAKLYSMNEDAD